MSPKQGEQIQAAFRNQSRPSPSPMLFAGFVWETASWHRPKLGQRLSQQLDSEDVTEK